MGKLAKVSCIILASILAWLLLRPWCPQGSERFHALFPITAVAILAVQLPRKETDSKRQILPIALYLLTLFGFCTAYACLIAGRRLLFTQQLSWEILLIFYFLIGMSVLLFGIRGVVRGSLLWLVERSWFRQRGVAHR